MDEMGGEIGSERDSGSMENSAPSLENSAPGSEVDMSQAGSMEQMEPLEGDQMLGSAGLSEGIGGEPWPEMEQIEPLESDFQTESDQTWSETDDLTSSNGLDDVEPLSDDTMTYLVETNPEKTSDAVDITGAEGGDTTGTDVTNDAGSTAGGVDTVTQTDTTATEVTANTAAEGDMTTAAAGDGVRAENEEAPAQHTFQDYLNPGNYDRQGHYVGDTKDWGYKPYGMENSELRQETDARAGAMYLDHLQNQPISGMERSEQYLDFLEKQAQPEVDQLNSSGNPPLDGPNGPGNPPLDGPNGPGNPPLDGPNGPGNPPLDGPNGPGNPPLDGPNGPGNPPLDGPNGPDDPPLDGPNGPGNPPLDGPNNPENNEKTEKIVEGEKLEEEKSDSDYEHQLEKTQTDLEKALNEVGEANPEIKETYEKMMESASGCYENAMEIAKLDKTLDNYTDHGPEHIKEVTTNGIQFYQAYMEYAKSQGIDPGDEAAPHLPTVVTSCVWHDTGMDGGHKGTAEYLAEQQAHLEKNGKDNYGDVIRSNHPLESAMHVLDNAEQVRTVDVNPNEVATVVYMHSKTNSGVKMEKDLADYNNGRRTGDSYKPGRLDQMIQYYQKKGIEFDPSTFAAQDKNGNWHVTDSNAFVRKETEQAVERMAETAKSRGLTYDPSFLGTMDEKGKFTITNEKAYIRLQYEAAILREADAQRPARNLGITQSQDGIKLSNLEGDYASAADATSSIQVEFVDPETGKPSEHEHPKPTDFSVECYSGESNVDCKEICYNETTGNLEIHYEVKDGTLIPELSGNVIQDRAKEAGMPVLQNNVLHVVHVHGVDENSKQGQYYLTRFGAEEDFEVLFD